LDGKIGRTLTLNYWLGSCLSVWCRSADDTQKREGRLAPLILLWLWTPSALLH